MYGSRTRQGAAVRLGAPPPARQFGRGRGGLRRRGHGIARVMSYQAAAAVAAGRLVVLLPKFEPPPIPVNLVMPSARSKTLKQRAFVEFAVPKLRERLALAATEIG